MAGTAIKGVGSHGSVQIPDLVTATRQNAGTSFQSVWNKTQNNTQTSNPAAGDHTQTGRSEVRRGESLRSNGRQRDDVVNVSDGENAVAEDDSMDSRDLEKVQEVVADHGYLFRQRRGIAGSHGRAGNDRNGSDRSSTAE